MVPKHLQFRAWALPLSWQRMGASGSPLQRCDRQDRTPAFSANFTSTNWLGTFIEEFCPHVTLTKWHGCPSDKQHLLLCNRSTGVEWLLKHGARQGTRKWMLPTWRKKHSVHTHTKKRYLAQDTIYNGWLSKDNLPTANACRLFQDDINHTQCSLAKNVATTIPLSTGK